MRTILSTHFKKSLVFTPLAFLLFSLTAAPSFADTVNVNFEAPTYHTGSINAQDGWSSLGSVGSGCAVYDHAVNTQLLYPSFGGQSLRLSDAVTSGCFGDQTFAKPLVDGVGETAATGGSFSIGNRQPHFEMQFDIASTIPSAQQPGMHISVSPDRGDGSRMSYLRFEDGVSGIDVFFDDVQGTSNPANFVETQIATGLNRLVPHTVKLTLDTPDGPSNDVVKVYIDGTLVHTGTSWENYYYYDSEAASEQTPRIVKTVLFRSSGTANPADNGNGFLIDNLSLLSGPTPVAVPPTFDTSAQANGGNKTTLTWNHTTTTQNDRLLVVGVSTDGGNVSSVMYGTQTLTKLSSQICPHSYTCNDEMWYVVNPASGTHQVKVTLASSGNVVGGSASFYNVSAATPFGTVGTNSGKGTIASVSVTTNTTQLVLDALAGNGNASWQNNASQTFRWGNNTLNDGKGSTKPASSGITTMQWTNSQTDDWADIAAPINGEVPVITPTVTPTSTPTVTPTPALDTSSTAKRGTGTTLSWTHTTTTQSNRLLVVTVALDATNASSSQVTYGGTPLTKLASKTCPNNCNDEIWYLVNPSVGTNTIVVTHPSGGAIVAGSSTYYNVDQVTPFGSFANTSGNSTSASATTTTIAGQLLVDAMAAAGIGGPYTPNAQQTQLYENNTINTGGSSIKSVTGSSTSMSWSINAGGGGDNWALIAAPIN